MGTCVYGYGCKPLESYWEYQRRNELVNWGCQNTMFRRELILKVGNFNETIKGAGEDYELYQRLLHAGCKWVWVREASAYHPMTMKEYIKHVRWWARGAPYIAEAANWAAKTSMLRVYGRQVFFMIESFSTGIKLSVEVHPTFLLFWPLIRLVGVLELLKGLKKISGRKKEGNNP
jgi:GT2 family glycosyltransferase